MNRTTLGIFAAAALSACGQSAPIDEMLAEEDGAEGTVEYESAPVETTVGDSVRQNREARARAASDPAVRPALERFGAGRSPSHDFDVRSVVRDGDGRRHARLDHRYRGVRVLTSTAILHVGASGETLSEDLRAVKEGIEIDTVPHLTEAEAVAVVDARPERTGRPLIAPLAELVILPEVERVVRETGAPVRGDEIGLDALDVERRVTGAKLVYQIDTLDAGVGEPFSSVRYLVDAKTGRVIRTKELSDAAEGTGKSFKSNGPANDFNVPIDTRPFISLGGAFFEPFDAFRNFGVWDEDFCQTCGPNRKSTNTWGDGLAFAGDATATTENRRTAIVDGLYGMQVTWDMFSNVFGRQGYNDAFYSGNAYVHSDTDWDNAKYYHLSGNIAVGDGPPGNRSNRTTLDTLAHEFGHGINDFTAGLGGNEEGEGLNEAAADIIGEIAEAYEINNGAFNALSFIPTAQLPSFVNEGSGRNFKNPGDPDAWSAGLASLPDEHTRALPMDHAFYFLSQGSVSDPVSSRFAGTIPWGMAGIGLDKAARIWIRALTVHMTSDTDYADARTSCLLAAAELFGSSSPERDAVKNAFAGISVGSSSAGYPASPSAMSESEPNTSLTPDIVIMPSSLPSGAPVTGSLSSRKIVLGSTASGDTDHFVLSVPAGKSLRVTLRGTNDNELTLFDPGGTVVDGEPNKTGTAPEQRIAPSASASRTFTIRVKFVSAPAGFLPAMYTMYVDLI